MNPRWQAGLSRSAPEISFTSNVDGVELTILMPCLNEAETVGICVQKASQFLQDNAIDGEVLVSDNGSTDGSPEIAQRAGARVVSAEEKGYGAALMTGIDHARGTYVIMGDADDSYDFSALHEFIHHLRNGADLVMGNRFKGGIEPRAMPPLHRYLGNPVLSAVGRAFFGSRVGDFHCGLRGFRRDAISELGLMSKGMEFASEMVVKATLLGLRIDEVPTVLYPDGRTRPPHLRTWRDGWRHLRFLLLFSPRWLFLYPGLVLFAAGTLFGIRLTIGSVSVGSVTFDVNTLIVCLGAAITGYQAVWFGVLSKAFASREGLLPADIRVKSLRRHFPLEKALIVSAAGLLIGITGLVVATIRWGGSGWGPLELTPTLRLVVPSVGVLLVSAQTALGSLMLSILALGSEDE